MTIDLIEYVCGGRKSRIIYGLPPFVKEDRFFGAFGFRDNEAGPQEQLVMFSCN